jgi:hypothetical protein
MKKKKLLYFFYNRLNDPLLQSNIFLYINALAQEGLYDIAIVTYEDEKFPLSDAQKKEIHQNLSQHGIRWYPKTWHAGSSLFLKGVDLLGAFKTLTYLVMVKGYRHVISLGSIAGSFLYLFSKTVRLKFYLYQYEPHSEYALDNKIWSGTSMQYKLLNRFEKKSVSACTVVSSGTDNMRNRLREWHIKAPFFKVSSVANDLLFNFYADQRGRVRKELNISGSQKLVIYPGKLGELYCSAARLVLTLKVLHRQDENFRFLVITPNGDDVKKALATESGLSEVLTLLSPVAYAEMPHYLSAADLGIVAVLPGPSKKFISNIKVGEYLCSGLPYLICRGISEDDRIAETYNVGVVVEDLTETEVAHAYKKINVLLSEPRQSLAERCRNTGILCRGFDKQYGQFKEAVLTLTA